MSAVGILTRVKLSPIASDLPLPQVYTSTLQDGAGLEDEAAFNQAADIRFEAFRSGQLSRYEVSHELSNSKIPDPVAA